MITIRQILNGNKVRLHLFFCLAIIVLLSLATYFLYLNGFRFKSLNALGTDWFLFILCIYTGRWLCVRWYLRGRLARFILYSVVAITAIAVLKWLIAKYPFNHPNVGFLELTRDAIPVFVTGLVLGMLLKLIRASMQKELLEAQRKTEQKEMEFNVLQSQLSPHFLFNVLNNLYGISIEEHERIPALLLKLSDLLRYTVYGTKKTFVPLKDELAYIFNYIEFEQIRTSDRLRLSIDIAAINNAEIKIAPQVLIVFIENAFKHSKNTLKQEIEITILLRIENNFIFFEVSNSYHSEIIQDGMIHESSGLGLANTIRRLDLLYGNDYTLIQNKKDDRYFISLRIKTKM